MEGFPYDLLNSAIYQDLMRLLGVAALLAVAGLVGVALFGGGPRRAAGERRSDWDMLFETWRDSFAVSALYVAFEFEAAFEQAIAVAAQGGGADVLAADFIGRWLRLLLAAAIAVICVRRFLALGRWLRARRVGEGGGA